MDPQFDTNITTFYFIIPLVIIGLVGLIWFFLKMKTSMWKRVTLAVISLFAFFGFITGVLAVYYQVNDAFAGMFKFYAYTKLAPETDQEGGVFQVLQMTDVEYQDGQLTVPDYQKILGVDYAGYLFMPGEWQWIHIKNRMISPTDIDNNGEPDIIPTSLWWALTNDPYKFTATVE